jgi:hypothetical protein
MKNITVAVYTLLGMQIIAGCSMTTTNTAPTPTETPELISTGISDVPSTSIITNTASSLPVAATGMTQTTIFFAQGSEGVYSLIDIKTGKSESFLPAGYELVGQNEYQILSPFLIIKKENDLYVYEVSTGEIRPIFAWKEQPLQANEEVVFLQSITDKSNFFITINTFDSNEQDEFYPTVIGSRDYVLDAGTNTLTNAKHIDSEACTQYDSKNQRFFEFRCTWGDAWDMLSIIDINGVQKTPVVSEAEKPNGVVKYSNGLFYVVGTDGIIIVDPSQPNITKSVYTASESAASVLKMINPYWVAFDASKKTMIIGMDRSVALLYLENGMITKAKIPKDTATYINFPVVHDGKAYYYSLDDKVLNSIDLDTWEFSNKIPVWSGEAITLLQK